MIRTLPAPRTLDTRYLWRIAQALALGGVLFVAGGIALSGYKGDAYIYWQASHLPADLYAGTWNHDAFSYVYPPIFAQLLMPLGLLPYPIFFAVWVAVETAALIWLAGPLLAFGAVLLYEPFQHELLTGNVNLMLAAAVVLAIRYPAWWAFPLLSKVTPGVGLAWYALRREWRQLGIALGITAALVAASFLTAPGLWSEWGARMGTSLAQPHNPDELLPLSVRLVIAAAVIAWGARSDRRWTMVLAAGLALPNFVPMNLAYFVALLPFLADRVRSDRVLTSGVCTRIDRAAGGRRIRDEGVAALVPPAIGPTSRIVVEVVGGLDGDLPANPIAARWTPQTQRTRQPTRVPGNSRRGV